MKIIGTYFSNWCCGTVIESEAVIQIHVDKNLGPVSVTNVQLLNIESLDVDGKELVQCTSEHLSFDLLGETYTLPCKHGELNPDACAHLQAALAHIHTLKGNLADALLSSTLFKDSSSSANKVERVTASFPESMKANCEDPAIILDSCDEYTYDELVELLAMGDLTILTAQSTTIEATGTE
ncbi:hypothetical protein [Vibrio alginolyticus]|uniref:hypothetical protein n=1 Tax=Vibrio TaxID=662 RepID=UPI0006CA84B5|nr:hypothetical protein [Vibrio alginolyticus]KPM97593.1 hypothetical protein AOG25_14080 [Vibrio alginolyticus]CAH7368883.1 conserved hypothetical protein [Vibrio chagasii]